MMMVLLDEPTLIVFASPENPPNNLETVDVINGEYTFCDERGQMYEGIVTKPAGWFREAKYGLRPTGVANIANALALVERAVLLEANPWFPDLKTLGLHLTRSTQDVTGDVCVGE
jgi:hypothetical protein